MMKRLPSIFLLVGFLVVYGLLFSIHTQRMAGQGQTMELAKPATYYRIAAGYLKQLAAESLFVKSSVQLGGALVKQRPPSSYGPTLGHNLRVMTQLYPRFRAPYSYAQAFLPHISRPMAELTNTLLQTGMTAYPEEKFFRFYYAINYFLSMNEPFKAAQAFADAAALPTAPPLFGRLASLLSTPGGVLTAGLVSLRTMLAMEKEPAARSRYEQEITLFEQALRAQEAVNGYTGKYGHAPQALELLVPEFLPELPGGDDFFTLIYEPPAVRLERKAGIQE